MSGDILHLEQIVSAPYCVYVVGEMGTGKTTFLQLLKAYEGWLNIRFGLKGALFHTFKEELPPCWGDYVAHKNAQEQHISIYEAQRWFALQKVRIIRQAAGLDDNLIKTTPDLRLPGFYLVDRSLEEDCLIFARDLVGLFPEGKYQEYMTEVVELLRKILPPDLIVRLRVENPEVSMQRVESRHWGEHFPRSRYYLMEEAYQERIDPWIAQLGIPVITIRTDEPYFDFKKGDAQCYFIYSFLNRLYEQRLWLLDYHRLPPEPLIFNNHS